MSSSWPAAPEAERPTGEGDLSFGGLPKSAAEAAENRRVPANATPSAGARQRRAPLQPREGRRRMETHAQGHGEAHGGKLARLKGAGAQGGLIAGGGTCARS